MPESTIKPESQYVEYRYIVHDGREFYYYSPDENLMEQNNMEENNYYEEEEENWDIQEAPVELVSEEENWDIQEAPVELESEDDWDAEVDSAAANESADQMRQDGEETSTKT